ncbi:MAG: glycosyltransferase family 2 protein [Roseobacter sp.]
MMVSVIIPTFNRLNDLTMVLAALEKQTMDGFEVIIIDNGSTDGTQEAMLNRAKKKRVFDLSYHRKDPEGPAAARNVGMARARAPLVVFLDSDVELAPDWLENAYRAMQTDPTLGAVGGQVRYANDADHLNAFGGAFSRIGLAWDRLEGAPIAAAHAPHDVFWMNCSAAMMRVAALAPTGGFDDRFFYAFEDSDVGWRLALSGWRQQVLPELWVLHHVGDTITASSDAIVFHLTKNRLASFVANAGPRLMILYLPILIAFTLIYAVLKPARLARIRALWWNLTHLGGTLRRRRQVQRLRVVSDADLLFEDRLFPDVQLGGKRRRPNRVQSVDNTTLKDDRV